MTLRKAVLLSLAVHGFMLFARWMPSLHSQTEMSGGLQATLRAVTQPEASVKPLPVGKISPATQTAQHPKAFQPVLSVPDTASTVSTKAAQPAEAIAAPVALAAPSPAAVAGVPNGPVLDSDQLREYKLQLARLARRFKVYPPMARQRGWEGTVSLLVQHPLPGQMATVTLQHGSGFEVLDQQALSMIERAVRGIEIPQALASRSFQIPLPIEFHLDE